MGEVFVDLFQQNPFDSTIWTGTTCPDDLFSMLDTFEDDSVKTHQFHQFGQPTILNLSGNINQEVTMSIVASRRDKIKVGKKRKSSTIDTSNRTLHITVERNRRKQMNENLSVLRSMMPRFYIKRGDQASIIGGVVDYIKELQQVLQSLEAKKQRKICTDVLSPKPATSPCLLPVSPKPSPFSPKLGLPISPRTPLPESPYKRNLFRAYNSSKILLPALAAYPFSASSNNKTGLEVGMASCTAHKMADVTVEFSGPNVLLKTISQRIPGQALKIIAALENLSLEILQARISIVDDTQLNTFTIKIGVECHLSADDLVQEIKDTFSQ